MQEDIELLKRLGYDTSDKIIKVFNEIISEVIDAMSVKDEKEAKKLVESKKSYIYVEPGCFIYEIGLNRLHKDLEVLHKNRIADNIDIELYSEVYSDNHTPTLEDSILSIATYKKNQCKKEKKQNDKLLKLV